MENLEEMDKFLERTRKKQKKKHRSVTSTETETVIRKL